MCCFVMVLCCMDVVVFGDFSENVLCLVLNWCYYMLEGFLCLNCRFFDFVIVFVNFKKLDFEKLIFICDLFIV